MYKPSNYGWFIMVYHCFANIHLYNPILVTNTMEPWSQCGNSMSFPTYHPKNGFQSHSVPG